jgi:hypothetical protein
MIEKLSQRDKRALKTGAVVVAAILGFVFVTTWFGHWAVVRESLAAKRDKLRDIDVSNAKQKGLWSKVPVFEMPKEAEEQSFLFRDKLSEQLKKAGVKPEPLKFLPAKKSRQAAGYKLLCLKCSGKAEFQQVLDLLADLNENPYLVGIEELAISCDPRKPQEVELGLTVSTFVKEVR